MSSCLGIYVDNNSIKYAKLSKERETIKIDTHGIKFYEDFNEAIRQIVEETYSYKLPISVNLSEEIYNYFDVFSLLTKKDMELAIKTEFESICEEKNLREAAYDSRYVLAKNQQSKEIINVIHVSATKTQIAERVRQFQSQRLNVIAPLPLVISNMVSPNKSNNVAIINMESKTTITIIINGEIVNVYSLNKGINDVLENINTKVNSYSKVYEILKGTTIYTEESNDLITEKISYLEDIMPTIFEIATNCKEMLDNVLDNVDTVYLTGMGATINNIDLYFAEILGKAKCEVLKPYFAEEKGVKKGILKDYIEVNSAISLALQGLDIGIKGINFKTVSGAQKLMQSINKGEKNPNSTKKFKFSFDSSGGFDGIEKMLTRGAVSFLTVFIFYIVLSVFVNNQIMKKNDEAQNVISSSNVQVALVTTDINNISSKSRDYTALIENLKSIQSQASERYQTKNSIPNLLYKIMNIVPREVQIISIKNTGLKQITIEAQADRYEELGYFKAKLKTEDILINVTSDSGVKQDSKVKVIIKGELQ